MTDDTKGEKIKLEELRDRVSECKVADDDKQFLSDVT